MPPVSIAFIFIALFFAVPSPADATERTRPVWLVSNGFHTSLAIRARDFPGGEKLSADPLAGHLLIGWGAADFYRGRKDLWTISRSITWPTPSALHVVPIRGAVARRFRRSDVIRLHFPVEKHRRLLAALDAAFARDTAGRRVFLGPGAFPRSRFYAGRERFCFFRMCNVWTAQKLRRGGLALFLPTTITASGLTRQAARFGQREQHRGQPADAF